MLTRVQKWGNSLGVRLPKSAAEEARISDGCEVDVRARNGEIVVRRVRRTRFTLGELLEGIRAENLHAAVDEDGPHGKELL